MPPPTHQEKVGLQIILNHFDEKGLRKTLLAAALKHDDVFVLITNRHSDRDCLESTKPLQQEGVA